jgi:hypothetical protein
MKTSNIIIIAFGLFILTGMLILFADGKNHYINTKNNFTYKEFALPAFSVIVAENGSDVHVDQSDSTLIKVEYNKTKATPTKLYEIKNDTLHVYSGLRMFVKCPAINALVGNKPYWLGVNGFEPDTLSIKMYGGKLNFNTDKTKFTIENGTRKLVNLNLIARDSASIKIRNSEIQHLSVAVNNAEIDIDCPAKNVTIKLENKAVLLGKDKFEQLTVQKDTSSVFKVTDF